VHSYLCEPMTVASLSGSGLMDEIVAVTVTGWLQWKVGHLRIFGCLVYIHVPKEKSTMSDLSARKGTFVGCCESSKAYQIYIPGQRQIEMCRDVSFEKEVAFSRSRGSHMQIHNETQEEMVSSPPHPSVARKETIDPVDPVGVPRDIAVGSVEACLGSSESAGGREICAPRGTFRESKRPQRFSSYVAAMGHIIDSEPSYYEEASIQLVWRDSMMEEYQSRGF
jgi:hypothetical protein